MIIIKPLETMEHFTISRLSQRLGKPFILFALLFFSLITKAQMALITPSNGGNIWEVQSTPDHKYLVIRGDLDGDGRGDLHSLLVSGGNPVLLDEVSVGGDLWQMQVSNSHVIYRGRRDAGSEDLYTVSLEGSGTPIKLLQVASNNGELYDDGWFITPDGTKVFAAGRLDDNGAGVADSDHDLWSFPIGGGTPTFLTEYSGDFWQVKISNTHVVYRGKIDGDGDEDLFSVPITGGTPVQLIEGDIRDETWMFLPDGNKLVYSIYVDGTVKNKLVVVNLNGTNPLTLQEGARDIWETKVSNTHVVYRGRIDDNDSDFYGSSN